MSWSESIARVSPYVTECPYCGTRLRKRAPKLERGATSSSRARAAAPPPPPRGRAQRPPASASPALATAERPYVTLAAILGSRRSCSRPARRRPERLARSARSSRRVTDAVVALPRGAVRLRRHRLPVRDRRARIALFVPGLERRLGAIPDGAPAGRLRRARDGSPPWRLDDAVRRRVHASPRAATASRSARSAPGSSSAAPRPRGEPTEELDWIRARRRPPCVLLLLPLGRRATPTWAGDRRRAGRAAAPASRPAARRRSAPVPDKFTALTPSCTPTWSSTARARTTSCAPRDGDRGELGDIAIMQIAPDQGAFMTLLVRRDRRPPGARARHVHRLLGDLHRPRPARGRAAGRPATSARSGPRSRGATSGEAGVADRIDLRLGPALETLARAARRTSRSTSPSSTPTRPSYPDYYEECLRLLRPGRPGHARQRVARRRASLDADDDDPRNVATRERQRARRRPTSGSTSRCSASPTASPWP